VPGPLTLEDIVDIRAYEREREEFRRQIIALKSRRRVSVGPLVSLVFENRETVRFQVQEMARAEKLFSDEQVQSELDAYNPLLPSKGQLSATLFIELTDEYQLRQWLPALVGIEHSIQLKFGGTTISSTPEQSHEQALTRETVTAAVHYVQFHLDESQIEDLQDESATLELDLGGYHHAAQLSDETKSELLTDLRG
jgi:hypothetical protein